MLKFRFPFRRYYHPISLLLLLLSMVATTHAEIRVGNIVVGDDGVQVGNTRVDDSGVHTNGIEVSPQGGHVPGVAGVANNTPDFDDDDDDRSPLPPGFGAGAGAGLGAGLSGIDQTKHSNANINGNRGSIVIDGKPVRNQTIINRSGNTIVNRSSNRP